MKQIVEEYREYVKKRVLFIVVTSVLLVLCTGLGITLGSSNISIGDVLAVFAGNGDAVHTRIILDIRLPRIIAAIIAGMVLSSAGVAMQSILRNPLGSPFTLGISHAAAFGAAFAIVVLHAGTLHSSGTDAVLMNNPFLVSLSAFFWSLVSMGVILMLARLTGSTPETLILTGIVLGSLFAALTTALQYFADDVQLASIVFWTFGDVSRAVWRDCLILGVVAAASVAYFMRNSWNYNVLDAGDETAKSLGVNAGRLRVSGMIAASFSTAVVVSYFGIIAFIGLVVPHIVRRIIGSDEQFLIPASALFGGLFLLVSDTAARTVIAPVVLPVGILTSFLGAPLFLYLLIKNLGRRYW